MHPRNVHDADNGLRIEDPAGVLGDGCSGGPERSRLPCGDISGLDQKLLGAARECGHGCSGSDTSEGMRVMEKNRKGRPPIYPEIRRGRWPA